MHRVVNSKKDMYTKYECKKKNLCNIRRVKTWLHPCTISNIHTSLTLWTTGNIAIVSLFVVNVNDLASRIVWAGRNEHRQPTVSIALTLRLHPSQTIYIFDKHDTNDLRLAFFRFTFFICIFFIFFLVLIVIVFVLVVFILFGGTFFGCLILY